MDKSVIIIASICTALLVICLIMGIKDSQTDINKADNDFSNFAQIEENLFYDIDTQIVYFICNKEHDQKGYGYITPYYASNGLPYLYIDGELTEIKRFEKSVKVIETKEIIKETVTESKKETPKQTPKPQVQEQVVAKTETPQPDGVLTKSKGVNWYQGHKETYYNLDMSRVVQTAQSKGIAGDYWVREDGCKMLGSYIMVAANYDVHPYGSTVATSLGTGIVVDTGGFASSNPQQIDISCNW